MHTKKVKSLTNLMKINKSELLLMFIKFVLLTTFLVHLKNKFIVHFCENFVLEFRIIRTLTFRFFPD
jgi:hypothetical protein